MVDINVAADSAAAIPAEVHVSNTPSLFTRRNALIGAAVVLVTAGLAYGVWRIMRHYAEKRLAAKIEPSPVVVVDGEPVAKAG